MADTKHSPTRAPTGAFSRKRGIRLLGLRLDADGVIKGVFGGNAYLAIICLLFICLFLLRASLGFFPGYRIELQEARQSGVEFVNVIKQETAGHTALHRKLEVAYIAEKRARFGEEEAILLLYNRFEAAVDDTLEDAVGAHAETIHDDENAAATLDLSRKVDQLCRSLTPNEISHALSPLGISSTTENVTRTAISLATEYALNDAEQPDGVTAITHKIRDGMGNFTAAIELMVSAGRPLKELETQLAQTAEKNIALMRRQREIPSRVASLREGSQKIEDPNKRAEKLAMANELETSLPTHLSIDEDARTFYQAIPEHTEIIRQLIHDIQEAIALIPRSLQSQEAQQNIEELRSLTPAYREILTAKQRSLVAWRHDARVNLISAMKAFFFGTQWQTNSSWQNVYGLVPLITGSLLIAGSSLVFAVPISIGAAVYVNQFAREREASFLKPAIEFIQAIPSVVLGLFGVLVLAGLLKDISAHPLLAWIPGFPIQERLNALLAALLLAFMAAPTIFTLAEDALNNVPNAYTEASLAMGATKLQTALKVVLPAATSGIIAAILLGFGRVIGETLVVLLVAGNKASVPDLTQGLAVITQPVHTMTSIIAQECGEVEAGSLHWMALFMVGFILFMISLSVNGFCQRILNKQS